MDTQSNTTIVELMHADLEVISPEDSVVVAADRMRARQIGSVLVTSVEANVGQEPPILGIVTDTDLVRKIIAKERKLEETPVSQIMTSPPLAIVPVRPCLMRATLWK